MTDSGTAATAPPLQGDLRGFESLLSDTMKCDLCEFEATNKEQFAGHRSAHVRRGELQKRPPRPTTHACKICNLEFPSGPRLGTHMRTHWSDEKLKAIFSYGKRRSSLRIALFKIGKEYRCELCNLGPEWNGQALVLQVDHIDGDRQNHDIKNLRFLCPNCHTQTPTYGSKKRTQV